uniref:HDC08083 n=1 Tax=Drosophila melanogaster TaxID=7227 RepID=Q6ILY7_DROME|nr:TPA_inf: HDC08083 [Drosophila melanogaster]
MWQKVSAELVDARDYLTVSHPSIGGKRLRHSQIRHETETLYYIGSSLSPHFATFLTINCIWLATKSVAINRMNSANPPRLLRLHKLLLPRLLLLLLLLVRFLEGSSNQEPDDPQTTNRRVKEFAAQVVSVFMDTRKKRCVTYVSLDLVLSSIASRPFLYGFLSSCMRGGEYNEVDSLWLWLPASSRKLLRI